jgi:TRAP-type C4-dicarboxylate transport system permease small subunit
MSQYVRIVSAISWAAGMLAVAFLASSVLVVCQMVFVRYVLGQSTIWQTEYAIYSIVAATFIGSAYVLMLKGHVNVDLLPMALPPRPRLVLNAISGALSLAFCALLAYSGWIYFYEAWEEGWRTPSVWRLPLWIPLLPLPLGIALLCLQYIAELWKLKEEGR